MSSTDSPANTEKTPFRRPLFYLYAVMAAFTGLLFLLLLTVLSLRWINPPATSFMYQQEWDKLEAQRYSIKEYWVPARQIPEHTMWAVVGAEDQLFWHHNGFDFESISEAWEDRQKGIRSRGASTITQQVAKNLFLWPAETFFRKGIEAVITVMIELTWPKERIIEVYLNIAEFGPGVFGIGKAAEEFYGMPAAELEPEMSSRLAAVLPNPKRMRVNPPSPFTRERSVWILRQMTQLSGVVYNKPPSTTKAAPDSSITLQHITPDSTTGSESLGAEQFRFKTADTDSLIFSFDTDTFSVEDSAGAELTSDSLTTRIDTSAQ